MKKRLIALGLLGIAGLILKPTLFANRMQPAKQSADKGTPMTARAAAQQEKTKTRINDVKKRIAESSNQSEITGLRMELKLLERKVNKKG